MKMVLLGFLVAMVFACKESTSNGIPTKLPPPQSVDSVNKQKADKLTGQAQMILIQNAMTPQKRIDSAFTLINKAISLNKNSSSALSLKSTLCFLNRDKKELLETSDQLIEIHPDVPQYIQLKAWYLSVIGKENKAKKYYGKAIKRYEILLKEQPTNFNLRLEYLSTLRASGDLKKTEMELDSLKKTELKDFEKEMLQAYEKKLLKLTEETKEQFVKYWNKEIDLDALLSQMNKF